MVLALLPDNFSDVPQTEAADAGTESIRPMAHLMERELASENVSGLGQGYLTGHPAQGGKLIY